MVTELPHPEIFRESARQSFFFILKFFSSKKKRSSRPFECARRIYFHSNSSVNIHALTRYTVSNIQTRRWQMVNGREREKGIYAKSECN